MKMNRILAALLACLMVLGLAACGKPSTSEDSNTLASPITTLSVSYGENMDDMLNLNLIPAEEEGKFLLSLIEGNDMTRGIVDSTLMDTLSKIYTETDLSDLNEQNEYGTGDAVAALDVTFADDSFFSCSFGGDKIPEKLSKTLASMKDAVMKATETMEPYRAAVAYDESVNADDKAVLEALFAHLSNLALENTAGMNMPAGDEYAFAIGIDTENEEFKAVAETVSAAAANTTVVQNMMSTVPHHLVLFTLNDGADAEALQKTLLDNAGWRKWVCVDPDLALTATKDNYVLFALTLADINAELTPALEAEGWTVTNTVENPNQVF